MKPDEDPQPAEVLRARRALDTLTPAHRAMVRRLARVMLLALDAPRPARRVRLAAVAAVAAVEPQGDDEETPDELARAEARRILTQHGRDPQGGAA